MGESGRVVMITGGSRGIGRAVAARFAEEKNSMVIVHYDPDDSAASDTLAMLSQQGIQAEAHRVDVSSYKDVDALFKNVLSRLGKVDVLVNNAGITRFVDFRELESLTEEIWDRILAVNVKGVFFCSRAVVPHMKQQGGGCIVNISSVAGITGAGSSIAYCASKAAVINLTMAFARTFAPEVRVNCVAPGFIDTRWHSGRAEAADYEALKQRVALGTPLARVCAPEDIAQVVLSLIQGADFATGQTLVVDGGGLMRP
jgi:3-oxoacyl-[acyl-carrier protein] reductase